MISSEAEGSQVVVGHGQPIVVPGRCSRVIESRLSLIVSLMRMTSHTSARLSPYTANTKTTTRAKLAFAGMAAVSCLWCCVGNETV